MLAGLLRSSRLTLLTGVAGAGKTCLLREGVLPRLARRVDDLPGGFASGEASESVLDAPPEWMERRHYGDACGDACGEPGSREVAIYLDTWPAGAPLDALRRQLCAAFGQEVPASWSQGEGPPPLRQLIETLCREHDARVLMVLDAFEQVLSLPPAEPGAVEFASEWTAAVNQPGLPAHFLLAVRQEAQASLARFHGELPALASNWIGLAPVPGAVLPSPGPVDLPSPAVLPAAQQAPLDAAAPAADPALPVQAEGAVPEAAERPFPANPAPAPAKAPWRRHAAAALLIWGLAGVGLAIWALPVHSPTLVGRPAPPAPGAAAPPALPQQTQANEPRDLDPGSATPGGAAPTPAQIPSAAADASWAIQTGPGQRTDAQVARELQQALAARLPSGDGLGLQIVHYDALEAARNPPDPTWRVIGPLFPEELQLLVRADSSLRFIHQIRGQRIVTLPTAEGAPAGTAALLHLRLFGQPPASGQVRAAAWPQALADLQAGRADVLLMVDGEPSAWLSELSAQKRKGLRLLSLDPAFPQTRQVLQSFLPVRMSLPEGWIGPAGPTSGAGRTMPTLAVMSFLTTRAPPASDADLLRVARAWCQALPELRRSGHPKWRAAQPWLPLGVGGPPVPGMREALARCAPSVSAGAGAPVASRPV